MTPCEKVKFWPLNIKLIMKYYAVKVSSGGSYELHHVSVPLLKILYL